MFVHLIYAAIYSVLVVSLLISYDLFIKNFKELNLRLSFKILIGIVLFISQVYFIISFSLNKISKRKERLEEKRGNFLAFPIISHMLLYVYLMPRAMRA